MFFAFKVDAEPFLEIKRNSSTKPLIIALNYAKLIVQFTPTSIALTLDTSHLSNG